MHSIYSGNVICLEVNWSSGVCIALSSAIQTAADCLMSAWSGGCKQYTDILFIPRKRCSPGPGVLIYGDISHLLANEPAFDRAVSSRAAVPRWETREELPPKGRGSAAASSCRAPEEHLAHSIMRLRHSTFEEINTVC